MKNSSMFSLGSMMEVPRRIFWRLWRVFFAEKRPKAFRCRFKAIEIERLASIVMKHVFEKDIPVPMDLLEIESYVDSEMDEPPRKVVLAAEECARHIQESNYEYKELAKKACFLSARILYHALIRALPKTTGGGKFVEVPGSDIVSLAQCLLIPADGLAVRFCCELAESITELNEKLQVPLEWVTERFEHQKAMLL